MLEFLVLGVVPGTHIQLTFGWLVAISLFIVLISVLIFDFDRIYTYAKTRLQMTLATLFLSHK